MTAGGATESDGGREREGGCGWGVGGRGKRGGEGGGGGGGEGEGGGGGKGGGGGGRKREEGKEEKDHVTPLYVKNPVLCHTFERLFLSSTPIPPTSSNLTFPLAWERMLASLGYAGPRTHGGLTAGLILQLVLLDAGGDEGPLGRGRQQGLVAVHVQVEGAQEAA